MELIVNSLCIMVFVLCSRDVKELDRPIGKVFPFYQCNKTVGVGVKSTSFGVYYLATLIQKGWIVESIWEHRTMRCSAALIKTWSPRESRRLFEQRAMSPLEPKLFSARRSCSSVYMHKCAYVISSRIFFQSRSMGDVYLRYTKCKDW